MLLNYLKIRKVVKKTLLLLTKQQIIVKESCKISETNLNEHKHWFSIVVRNSTP